MSAQLKRVHFLSTIKRFLTRRQHLLAYRIISDDYLRITRQACPHQVIACFNRRRRVLGTYLRLSHHLVRREVEHQRRHPMNPVNQVKKSLSTISESMSAAVTSQSNNDFKTHYTSIKAHLLDMQGKLISMKYPWCKSFSEKFIKLFELITRFSEFGSQPHASADSLFDYDQIFGTLNAPFDQFEFDLKKICGQLPTLNQKFLQLRVRRGYLQYPPSGLHLTFYSVQNQNQNHVLAAASCLPSEMSFNFVKKTP